MADPAQYAYTNVKKPACPATGVGADGLPTYSFPTCTEAALSASIPVGETSANWWKSYAFADSFHPRSEEHTSELQSQSNLVCRLLLEKKKKKDGPPMYLGSTTSTTDPRRR